MIRSILATRRAGGAWLLFAVCLVVAGCSKGPETGTVSGMVKYKGQPLTNGTVYFHSAKGSGSQAKLDGSGNYTLAGEVEVGAYKVYIQPPIPETVPPGTPPKKAPPFDLPPKYQDLGQTPVSKEVKVGPNTINIDLE